MRRPGGWRAGGVGGRSIAIAVLVAAGLSVATAGAASAGEPDDEGGSAIVICENGERVTRELSEEDRERLREVPDRVERLRTERRHHHVERDEVRTRVLPDGRVIQVMPAEPGAPCDRSITGPRGGAPTSRLWVN